MDRCGEIDAAAARLICVRGGDIGDAAKVTAARREILAWLRGNEITLCVMLTLLERTGECAA